MPSSEDRPALTPEQDAVRRLLADARHDEPVPPEVAARLDAVLAELSAERGVDGASRRHGSAEAPGERAAVVDLAARRRRGIGTALVAAAAVVVAGAGIGQVLGGASDSGGESTSASDGAGDDWSAANSEEGSGAHETGPTEANPDSTTSLERDAGGTGTSIAVPEVSSGSLRRDLRAALRPAPTTGPGLGAGAAPGSVCAPADTSLVGSGRRVPVVLDGRPAVALYRVPQGARRQVDVYLCGTGVPAESVVLRAR